MIGTWLSNRPRALADQVHIATKVAPASLTGSREQRFDRRYIQAKLETSLHRLRRPDVALYLAHAPCEVTPIEEVVEAFESVLASGRAQRIGCCNINPVGLTAALEAADRLGVRGFGLVQNSFSLLDPHSDREVRAICRRRGIVYSPYSPLGGGILTGKYRRGEEFPPDSRMALRPDGRMLSALTHDALDLLRSIAAERDASCAGIALAWVMGHPDCAAPVIGPSRNAPHLSHAAEAKTLHLTDGERLRLEEAFGAAAAMQDS